MWRFNNLLSRSVSWSRSGSIMARTTSAVLPKARARQHGESRLPFSLCPLSSSVLASCSCPSRLGGLSREVVTHRRMLTLCALLSSRWLVNNGRDDEALQVLCKLRALPPTDSRVLREWFDIRSEAAYRKEISMERHPNLHNGSTWNSAKLQIVGYLDCFRKGAWKRTHVGIGLMFFQRES